MIKAVVAAAAIDALITVETILCERNCKIDIYIANGFVRTY